jgi:hypothetical protein
MYDMFTALPVNAYTNMAERNIAAQDNYNQLG